MCKCGEAKAPSRSNGYILLDYAGEYGKTVQGSKSGKAYVTTPVMRVDTRDAAGLMRNDKEYTLHDPNRAGHPGSLPAGAAADA